MLKAARGAAEGSCVEEDAHTSHEEAGGGAVASVRDGQIHIEGPAGAGAELRWSHPGLKVKVFGEPVSGMHCRVQVGARVDVVVESDEPRVDYAVEISRDRMSATLRATPEQGCARSLVDLAPKPQLTLHVSEEPVDAPAPTAAQALAAVQAAGVVHGVDTDAIAGVVEKPNATITIATGTEPIEGKHGFLEPLVDFEGLRFVGVLEGTPLVRRVRKRDGIPGRDVTGKELAVAVVREARITAGQGVDVDEQGIMAVATVDGAPSLSGEGRVEVRHELVLKDVDTITGDVEFNGTVRVTGSVHEGRRLVARDAVQIDGHVDRATVEAGGTISVDGSIMSSVLRAGGERAVAATIADRVLELPRLLGVVTVQARQFRDQAQARNTEISHGLSIQLVLERIHKSVLPIISSIADDLDEAGPAHAPVAERAKRWHRQLATAANTELTPEQVQAMLVEIGALADDVTRALEQAADLHVNYMQASEAEATGAVTISGKGIFNSRIVAWGGLQATNFEAVFRGGSMLSRGAVRVREIGSPAGAKTVVQLGGDASLDADRIYAGSMIVGPGYTHRFNGDRASVHVAFDTGGSMNVESLAA